MYNRILIILLLILSCNFSGFTQRRLTVELISKDSASYKLKLKRHYNDSLSLESALFKTLKRGQRKGFIASSVDTITYKNDTASVVYFFGNRFKWNSVKTNFVGINNKVQDFALTKDSVANWQNIERYFSNCIDKYSNSGYPFIAISIDSVKTDKTHLKGVITVNSGPQIVYDNNVIKGPLKINEKYLSKVINIKPNNIYINNDVKKIDKQLQALSFVKLIKPSELEFNGNKCTNYIYLDKRRVNNFSGIVGLNSDKGKTKLTGELLFDIKNLFKNGESFLFNWQSMTNATQQLHTKFDSPYLLWDFGAGVDFSFYKRDSSFISVNPKLFLQFNLSGNNNIKLIYSYQKSYNVGEAAKIKGSNAITKNLYGFSFTRNTYNTFSLTSNGYNFSLSALGGSRLSFDDANNENSSAYFQFDFSTKNRLLLHKNIDLNLSASGGYMLISDNTNQLDNQNELYRVGGIRNIRGFNDDEFFTPKYACFSLEPGFVVGDDIRLFTFIDLGLLAEVSGNSLQDPRYGTGLGFQWIMNRGIVKMSYALGWFKNNPMSFQRAKVNVSYMVVF